MGYIDEVVQVFYNGSRSDAFRAFVEDEANVWCPTWIRKNYKVLNADPVEASAEAEAAPTTQVHFDKQATADVASKSHAQGQVCVGGGRTTSA